MNKHIENPRQDRKFQKFFMRTIILFCSLGLLVYACSNPASKEQHTGKAPKAPLSDTFEFSRDSAVLPGFEILVELSKRAEDTLKALHESVIVKAYFSGIPKDTTSEEYQEMGQVGIGDYEIELKEDRIARFARIALLRKDIESLKDRNFEVLINVFSGRRATDINLLNVDILQEGIDSIAGKQFILKGKLIGE